MSSTDPLPTSVPTDLPAWSDVFHGAGLGARPDLLLEHPITRDWAYGDRSGRGVRVAVIDSGVDGSHPLVGGVDEYVAIVVDPETESGVRIEPGPHEDLYGHGTACAGVIRSLAPEVELVSVRVLGASLKGSAGVFAHGVQWCIDNRITVANLSLSTTNDRWAETFHQLVDAAAFGRMLMVSAMANERKRSIPSEFAGVFSVACGPGTDREQFWCNGNGPAEWGAPGIGIEVAWNGHSTITTDGNSFAAPTIAGHLARIMGAHPHLTSWQARTVLAALAANSAD
ncbi:S8 family serine peptidase [Ilumatobacter nonamiensis]|uniref:S8 family serine peptidase n=1 Tax=Ilumatobacter nonamiensis TaxID=467093 RepID=UPI00034AA9C0|nr:S8 family serine peptidase [Ilumatobacter nonamiensis]